jgi:hypothetical protein
MYWSNVCRELLTSFDQKYWQNHVMIFMMSWVSSAHKSSSEQKIWKLTILPWSKNVKCRWRLQLPIFHSVGISEHPIFSPFIPHIKKREPIHPVCPPRYLGSTTQFYFLNGLPVQPTMTINTNAMLFAQNKKNTSAWIASPYGTVETGKYWRQRKLVQHSFLTSLSTYAGMQMDGHSGSRV